MKAGDKVYCICARYNITDMMYFNPGVYYDVLVVYKNIVKIRPEYNNFHISVDFSIEGDSNRDYLFSDYFLTLSEVRKNKLNKIGNENRR